MVEAHFIRKRETPSMIGLKTTLTMELKQVALDPTGTVLADNYVLQYKIDAEMRGLDWEWAYDFTAVDPQYLVIPTDGTSLYPTYLGNVGLLTQSFEDVPGMHFRAETLDFTQEGEFPGMCYDTSRRLKR